MHIIWRFILLVGWVLALLIWLLLLLFLVQILGDLESQTFNIFLILFFTVIFYDVVRIFRQSLRRI